MARQRAVSHTHSSTESHPRLGYMYVLAGVSICMALAVAVVSKQSASSSALDNALAFMEQRGVFERDPNRRDLEFGYLRDPQTAPLGLQKHYHDCQTRLLRLLAKDTETFSEEPPDDAHHFDPAEFPGYGKTIVSDHKTRTQRHQLSGLCYMHGPATCQYYAIWHAQLQANPEHEADHEILDLGRFIKNQFTGDQLEEHVFSDQGGNSVKFLEQILEHSENYTVPSVIVASFSSLYADHLAKYGPGLVAQFKVYPDFDDDSGRRKHYGRPRGELRGLHAMVMVGARRDDAGRQYFLLQNWWKDKQFLEVDEEYLKACGATVYFIETPQTKVPDAFPTHKGKWSETENLDKAERYQRENWRT